MKRSKSLAYPLCMSLLVLTFSGSPVSASRYICPPRYLDNYSTFIDAWSGYTVRHPLHMKVDTSLSPIRIRLETQDTIVDIYKEKVAAGLGPGRAIYANRNILSGRDPVRVISYKDNFIRGKPVKELWWERPSLSRVAVDRRFYASIDIFVSDTEVCTILAKSTNLEELEEVVKFVASSIDFGEARSDLKVKPVRDREREYPLSPQAAEMLDKLNEQNKPVWGIFDPTFPRDVQAFEKLEERLGYEFGIVLHYSSLESKSPAITLNAAREAGKVTEETLQITLPKSLGLQASLVYRVLNGEFEEYLRSYAKAIASYGGPVLFRLNNEMNGEWCSYSAVHNSKDPDLFIEVWKYIWRIFKEEGANNCIWIWNPHDLSFPDYKWNHPLVYYPGGEFVDMIGLTGYNTGTYFRGERWRSFREIFDPMYKTYSEYFPDKPFIVTEFGSNSFGGDKPSWIEDAITHVRNYPRIKAWVWWNSIDWDGTKPARIYKLDENEKTIEAFKRAMRSTGEALDQDIRSE